MIPIEDFKQQHEEIGELMKVLMILIQDESVRNTHTVAELFERLTEKVKNNFALEDKMYGSLLSHDKTKAVALRFLPGTRHIKKFFDDYTRRWHNVAVAKENAESFIQETQEAFRLLQERFKHEDEDFFRLIEETQRQ